MVAIQELSHWKSIYKNDSETNDEIFRLFREQTDQLQVLKDHRDYIEENQLGFGERAFHFMWYIIIQSLQSSTKNPKLLEIGVYKGQVLSLWALLLKRLKIDGQLVAISPLSGNEPKSGLVYRFRKMFDPGFRRKIREGNIYVKQDYQKIVEDLFTYWQLSFDEVKLLRGFSNDPQIIEEVQDWSFDVIYIDGDHSYDGCLADIAHYAPLVKKGGFLCMDDAGYFLEGTRFWKGHKAVSEAVKKIPEFGFENILNIGHNRLYQKL